MSGHAAGPRNPEIRSEKTDASSSAIVKFLVYLLLGTLAVVVLLRWMFVALASFEERQQPPPPVMKVEVPEQPPLPRLQQRPAEDMRAYRDEQRSVLESYGWVDRNAGVVHIPIEEAMRLLAERGLPARAGEARRAEPANREGKKE